ncbi:MAG: potassium transporter TrkG [Candidatus Margulisiibacteriota bacterium]
MNVYKIKVTPLQLLACGYLLVTLAGAFLLSLPISNANGIFQPFIDSLFLATSGISTSGLTVVDIGTYYTIFGQTVLMCIFQIGGIGYMTFIIFVAYLFGEKISLMTGIIAKESLATKSHGYDMLGKFFKNVLIYTLVFESVGAVILSAYWAKEFTVPHAVYLGIFHSISTFCTAGFSTFSTSFMNYKSSMTMNLTVNILSLIGGIGFFVLMDLHEYFRIKAGRGRPRLSSHSKIALIVTLIVAVIGTAALLMTEHWPAGFSTYDKTLAASFQAISASTTDGFNSIDIGTMSASGLTVLMALMFIGASPGSTGGGMKTTTLGIMVISMLAYLRGKKNVVVLERKIPIMTILRAFSVFSLFAMIATIDLIILANTENASYIRVFFEIISALGNTGLSTGITASLTGIGKVVLIITMFIGRVGPITIAMGFFAKPHREFLGFPQEDIFVG